MPTKARANRTDADAEGGAALAEKRIKVRVSLQVVSLLQMVLQHAAEAFADKTTELSDVLTPINNPKLREVNWHSNPGNVIEALLHAAGLGWSSCGKKLWRRAEPTEVIEWRPPQKGRSLRPAAPKATTLGALDDIGLQHDAHSGAAGSRGAQRAAEAARPPAPRALELVKPDAVDSLKRGSGWGNTPRPLSHCCIAEQPNLDCLVLLVQEHARSCGCSLKRVDGAAGIYHSSHSMGLVNVFRLVCDAGCSYNWSSAAPLPGPPAPTPKEAAAAAAAAVAPAAAAAVAPAATAATAAVVATGQLGQMLADTHARRAAKAAEDAAMSLRVLQELQGQMDVGIRVNPALARMWGVGSTDGGTPADAATAVADTSAAAATAPIAPTGDPHPALATLAPAVVAVRHPPLFPLNEDADDDDAADNVDDHATGTVATGAVATAAPRPTLATLAAAADSAVADSADVRSRLRRAIAYARQSRPKLQLKELAEDMGIVGKPDAEALRRFVAGQTTSVTPSRLAAYDKWAREHQAPPAQTGRGGAQPADYWANISARAAAHLCGAEPARLSDWVAHLNLGELNNNVDTMLKPALAKVLEEMDKEDTAFVVEMVLLAGDLSAAYDGFHSQNRNARSGIGNFTSHAMGFVLLITVLDKHRSAGVGGVSQRLEKEGLKRGLYSLIHEYGLPLRDLCTDQCRGAPGDIKLVLEKPEVQKLLTRLPGEMQTWAARELHGCVAGNGADNAEAGPRRPWASAVAELRSALDQMVAVAPADLATIVHHYDVYHVEVKVIDAFRKLVERETKTMRVVGDEKALNTIQTAKKALPSGFWRHKGLSSLLRAQHRRAPLPASDIEALGGEAAMSGDADLNLSIPEKQQILMRNDPSVATAWAEVQRVTVAAAKGPVATAGHQVVATEANVLGAEEDEGMVLNETIEEADAAAAAAAEVAEEAARAAAEAAEEAEEAAAAAANQGAVAVAAAKAAKARADKQASKAEAEAQKQRVREANASKLKARDQLLGAAAGLCDTIRHHFCRVSEYASLLLSSTLLPKQCSEAAWELWQEGLLGHVYRQDHSHCAAEAECKKENYVPKAPLNELARSIFVSFVNNPKMKELISKCIYNGHTWDSESLSNLSHMYQSKRIVLKRWQLIPMLCGKLDKNENRLTRRITAFFVRARSTGMRRLAQKDSPRLCPIYSPKTSFWRREADSRLYRALVDRTAILPPSNWPATRFAVPVVRPILRAVVDQLPPIQPPTDMPTPQLTAEERAQLPTDFLPRIERPSALREVPVPSSTMTVVGPQVGDRGSINHVLLSQQPPGCPAAAEPLLPSAVAAQLESAMKSGRETANHSLVCPGCRVQASVALLDGISRLSCDACTASFYAMVDPPQVKRMGGRQRASHHALPMHQERARSTNPYRRFMQEEMPHHQRAADSRLTSREAFKAAAAAWTQQKRQEAEQAEPPRQAPSRARQPRRQPDVAPRVPSPEPELTGPCCTRGHALTRDWVTQRECRSALNETLKCDMCDQWNIKAGQKVFSCRARECMEEGGFDVCGACGEGDADTPLEQPQPDVEPPEVVEQAAAVELANAQEALPPVAPALMAGVEPPAALPARPPRASRRRADTGNRGGVAAAGPAEPEGGMHVETEPEAPGSATKAHEGLERVVRRRRAVNFSE